MRRKPSIRTVIYTAFALGLCFIMSIFSGCSAVSDILVPDSVQLDLYEGYGNGMKLLHLNASSSEKRERITAFSAVLQKAEPLKKSPALFAYYPDFRLEIYRDGKKTGAVLDLNGDYVDFYYTGQDDEPDQAVGPPEQVQLYRSSVSSLEFRKILHQY